MALSVTKLSIFDLSVRCIYNIRYRVASPINVLLSKESTLTASMIIMLRQVAVFGGKGFETQ